MNARVNRVPIEVLTQSPDRVQSVNGTSGQRIAYVRVSAADQNPARQLAAVGQCDRIFTEHASGKSVDGRPKLAELIGYARSGDVVVVASMDRLARSLTDLTQIIQELTSKGARTQFLKENLEFSADTDDPFARLQLHLIGAIAEFERDLIRQRQREGIETAKRRGAYKGRPPHLAASQIEQLRTRAAAGESKATLAREYNISRSTLYRYLRAAHTAVTRTTPAAPRPWSQS